MNLKPTYVHVIQRSLTERDFSFLSHFSQIGVLVDENTYAYCYLPIKKLLPFHHLIQIQSGEKNKNIITCQYIWQKLAENNFDRKAILLNLGGGVIGDIGGFCATTYKRGIAFMHIPTTLLSQVDASIGGKLGINFLDLKNYIGIFQEPYRVLIDSTFLESLPEKEMYSGFAEIIKYSLIADVYFWEEILNYSFKRRIAEFIMRSIAIKHRIITQDVYEKYLRKILNFGHTIGHAIESSFFKSDISVLHGEAIGMGMICESFLSHKKKNLSEKQMDQIVNYLLRIYGKIELFEVDFEKIQYFMIRDKKNEKEVMYFSLLSEIGKCHPNYPVTWKEVMESLYFYKEL